MRRRLVGDHVGADAALEHFRKYVGGIAKQTDRHRASMLFGPFDDGQGVVDAFRLFVHVAGTQSEIDAVRIAFDGDTGCARHGRGERLGAAHAAESGGQYPSPGKVAVEMLTAGLDEGFVGALHDALRADIDP